MATHKVDFPTHSRPTTGVNTIAMLGIAAAGTAVLYVIFFMLPNNFIRDLFVGNRGPDEIAKGVGNYYWDRLIFCGLITYMWALSTVNVMLKLVRIRKLRASLDESTLPDSLNFDDSDQIRQAYDRVRNHADLEDSIGLTRVCRILAVWINTENVDRAVEVAKEEQEVDAFVSDSTYRLNRLYIWALPVLGFIGTVYGVSLAVSNFAGFLQGAVTPEAIKVQVGMITTGLGVAFYTTLLGLIFATLAAFASLLTEDVESNMLEEINELVEDRLVLHMPNVESAIKFPIEEMANAISESLGGMQSQIKFPVEELAQAIDAGFKRLPNPDRYEEVFSRAIAKAGDLINQKYDEFAQNYERRVGELGSQMGGKLEAVGTAFSAGTQRLAQQLNDQSQKLAQSLNEMESRQAARLDAVVEEMRKLAEEMPEEFRKAQEKYLETQAKLEAKANDRFEELTESISTMGKDQAEQFGDAHEKYLEAITDLDRKEIARWEKMVADFNQLAARLAEQFKAAVGSMDSATARYGDRVDAAAKSLGEEIEKVGQIGAEIDKVLRTTQSLETTLRQVGSSDEFRQTLSNLRNHLQASDELIKQLSRPRKVIFQETRAEEA